MRKIIFLSLLIIMITFHNTTYAFGGGFFKRIQKISEKSINVIQEKMSFEKKKEIFLEDKKPQEQPVREDIEFVYDDEFGWIKKSNDQRIGSNIKNQEIQN